MTTPRPLVAPSRPPAPGWFARAPLVGLLLGIAPPAALAQQAPVDTVPLPPLVSQALEAAQLPPQALSAMVIPVDAPAPRLSYRSEAPVAIASLMKLFTTGVALQTLGPAYTWRTEVGLGGPLRANGTLQGPLFIRGGGDPSLVTEKIDLMMRRWRAGGLRWIDGDMVLDRSAFAPQAQDAAAFDGQPLKPYNALPDALLLAHQAVILRFAPDAAHPRRARVTMEPELADVTLRADVLMDDAAPCGDWRAALKLQVDAGVNGTGAHVAVQGRYPRPCGEREWPVHWPGGARQDHTERVLEAAWRRAGGRLRGRVTAGPWPPDLPVWTAWESPPLAQMVRDINKFSNNVMARQLFLTLSRTLAPPPATPETARRVVADHVLRATRSPDGTSPCQGDALVLDNGSGLSRQEKASAACIARWLQALWSSPAMPDMLASLPLVGVDGTARRMEVGAGRAHLKTGSLEGVAGIAGVALADSGRRYVLVGVLNHPRADAGRPVLAALLAWTLRDQ